MRARVHTDPGNGGLVEKDTWQPPFPRPHVSTSFKRAPAPPCPLLKFCFSIAHMTRNSFASSGCFPAFFPHRMSPLRVFLIPVVPMKDQSLAQTQYLLHKLINIQVIPFQGKKIIHGNQILQAWRIKWHSWKCVVVSYCTEVLLTHLYTLIKAIIDIALLFDEHVPWPILTGKDV